MMNCPKCHQSPLKRLHGKYLSCDSSNDRHLFLERVIVVSGSEEQICILELIDKTTGWPTGHAYKVQCTELP
jgi:hypothetical protein